jgi:hypothetical protein
MKYVPAQLSSFLRCNKIEKCLFRLSGLFGLSKLNRALLAAFSSAPSFSFYACIGRVNERILLLFQMCVFRILSTTPTLLTDITPICTKLLQLMPG